MDRSEVHIRIPATSANLGPGFDVLAVALSLDSILSVRTSDDYAYRFQGEWDEKWNEIAVGMAQACAEVFYKTTGLEEVPVSISLDSRVPVARGLGSSAIIFVGLLCALNELHNRPLCAEELLTLAVRLEGSPDNASAAMLGGFTVSSMIDGKLRYLRFPVSEKLRFIGLVPTAEVTTDSARAIFPETIQRSEAILNAARSALIVAAFARQDYESLKGLFRDVFHQPYRERHYPELRSLSAVIHAAEEAGALGAYLSGSGSTIMAVTLQSPADVGIAMRETFWRGSEDRRRDSCRIYDLSCSNEGASVLATDQRSIDDADIPVSR